MRDSRAHPSRSRKSTVKWTSLNNSNIAIALRNTHQDNAFSVPLHDQLLNCAQFEKSR